MPSSPIIARADALMQRRRQNPDSDDVPLLTDAIDPNKPETDDDIPVLRHIESSEPRPPHQPVTPTHSPAAPTPPRLPIPPPQRPAAAAQDVPFPALNSELFLNREDVAHDLARRIEKRLTAELPRLIAAAVADYLAEQDGA
jgi:hypothetical protein